MNEVEILRGWFDNCRAELEEAAETWRQTASTALEAAHGSADSMRFANRLYHAKRALDRMQPFLPRRFIELLERSMGERAGGASPPFRAKLLSDDSGLVDDSVVNESIEVSRIAARVLAQAEWQIREAEEGLARRTGRKWASERGSPFHPEAFARALWRLTEEMSLNAEERAACLRVAPDAIADLAGRMCACAIGWLGRTDATANFVLKRSTSNTPVAIPVDVSLGEPGALEFTLDEPPAPASRAPGGAALDARDHVFRDVIASIDAVLSDFRLTPELKRVLSGLQMVVMRFAFGSPQSMYAPEHRLWSVSRKLAAHALAHCLRDRIAHDDFILFADHTIQALLPLDTRSLDGLAPHLDAIDHYVRTRAEQLIANEENAMQHLARLEDRRRKVLGAAINRQRERIAAAIGHTDMPFRLRQFMLADWAEVLARTELSEGQESDLCAEYWGAVHRVVERMRAVDTQRTVTGAPDVAPLLAVLERGMASIAVPSVEKHELESALAPPGMAGPSELQESDFQARAAAEPLGDPGRRRRAFWGARDTDAGAAAVASTTGLTSAVPASDAEHWVNTLRLGSVIELFLLGTWFEARVITISSAGHLFMFKDELGGGSHPLTRRALLRLVREGLAGPL